MASPTQPAVSLPTIGRIVWFKARDGAICPAIVTKVWDVSRVALQVFHPGQPSYGEHDVGFDVTRSDYATWSWPER